MIDLRSDTLTVPSDKMLNYMYRAEVGDDVFEEDPTVSILEKKISNQFGFDDALFCPSGTMTNQIAIKVHTNPGDEVICDRLSHIYNYEAGGVAFNSLCSVRLINSQRGIMDDIDIKKNINNYNDIHLPITSLVCLENTTNKGGGDYYTLKQISDIYNTCKENNLKLHLDGARIFNAILESKISCNEMGGFFDSVSICLSKGLGCPVGSLLLGDAEFITKSRRVRKIFGGGMRQVGYMAACGVFALDNNIERLLEDHKNAKKLENVLIDCSWVKDVLDVKTNIVVFYVEDHKAKYYVDILKEKGIFCLDLDHNKIRFVTHLNVSSSMIDKAIKMLRKI